MSIWYDVCSPGINKEPDNVLAVIYLLPLRLVPSVSRIHRLEFTPKVWLNIKENPGSGVVAIVISYYLNVQFIFHGCD